MSRPQPIVQLTEVAKAFGAVKAVRGVSLAILPGERVGLVGHNGAGKSTLMNLLLGATAPDSGQILIDGSDATGEHDVSRAFAHGIRCVFQELSLCPI
jgi:ribose transport system ATP-binding protein